MEALIAVMVVHRLMLMRVKTLTVLPQTSLVMVASTLEQNQVTINIMLRNVLYIHTTHAVFMTATPVQPQTTDLVEDARVHVSILQYTMFIMQISTIT